MKFLSVIIGFLFILNFRADSQINHFRFYPNFLLAIDTTAWTTYFKIEDVNAPNNRLTFGHRTRLGVYVEISTNSYYDFEITYNERPKSETLSIKEYNQRQIHMRTPLLTECVNGAFGAATDPKGTIWASIPNPKNENSLVARMEFPIADSSYALSQIEKLIDSAVELSPDELDKLYGYPFTLSYVDTTYEKRYNEVRQQNQLFYEKNARCLNDPDILELLRNQFPSTPIDSLAAAQSIAELAGYYGQASATKSLASWKYALEKKCESQFTFKEYYALRDSLFLGLVGLSHFRSYYKKLNYSFPFERYIELEECESELTQDQFHLQSERDNGLTFETPFLHALSHQLFSDSLKFGSVFFINGDCDLILAEVKIDNHLNYCLLRRNTANDQYTAIINHDPSFRKRFSSFNHSILNDYCILHAGRVGTDYVLEPKQVIHLKSGKAWAPLLGYDIESLTTAVNYTDCLVKANEFPYPQKPCMKEGDLYDFKDIFYAPNTPHGLMDLNKYVYILSKTNSNIYHLTPAGEASLRPSEKSFTTSLMEHDFQNDGSYELFQYTVSNGKLIRYVYYTMQEGELISVQSRKVVRQIKKTAGYRNMVLLSLMGASD